MANSEFLEMLASAVKKAAQKIDNLIETVPDKNEDHVELLTADKLNSLKWMSSRQLAAIYGYGKRKTKIADDARAYSALKWFSEDQLYAIFGNPEDNNNGNN